MPKILTLFGLVDINTRSVLTSCVFWWVFSVTKLFVVCIAHVWLMRTPCKEAHSWRSSSLVNHGGNYWSVYWIFFQQKTILNIVHHQKCNDILTSYISEWSPNRRTRPWVAFDNSVDIVWERTKSMDASNFHFVAKKIIQTARESSFPFAY